MSWLSVGHFEDYVQVTKLDFIKSQYQTLSCIICTKWEYGMTQIHHLGNCKHTEGNWMWTRRIPKEMEHHWVLINLYKMGEFLRRNTTQVMTWRWIFATVAGWQQRITRDVDHEACGGPSSYPWSTKYQPYLVILYHITVYFPMMSKPTAAHSCRVRPNTALHTAPHFFHTIPINN